jgi:LuxR family maltose regulon positive regulatory protein
MQRLVDPDAFVMALPVSDSTLTSYLIEEVLNSQTAEIREFLLRTSIVERLCPELADALSGRSDSYTVLAALQTANVLTEALDDAPGWYRYYPLFAQVLRLELRRQHPELFAGLHGRASAWFGAAGLLTEAAGHAAAAGDWQQAASTLVRRLAVGELLAGREAARLSSLFQSMPAGEPGAMPAVVRAAQAVAHRDAGTCRAQLRAAEAQLGSEAEEDRAPVRTCIAVIRAVLAGIVADADAAEAALAAAEAQLPALADREAAHPELRALVLASVGGAQLWAGRFGDAEQTLLAGIAAARRPGCEHLRLNMIERLAWVEYRKGHLRRAAELGEEAIQLAETAGLPVRHRTGAAHLTLAMVALEWNDRAGLRQHLRYTAKTVDAQPDPVVATVAPMMRAWQYARASDFRRAFAALAEVPTSAGDFPLPPWLAARVMRAHAAVHLRHGDPAAAAAALERAAERGVEWTVSRAGVAVASGDHQQALDLLAPVLAGAVPLVDAILVEAWLVVAKVRLDRGDRAGARDALGRALDAAQPEGHRRAFVDAGPWVRALLRANRDLASLHRWLGPPLIDRAVNGRALAERPPNGEHQPAHRVGGPFADTVPVVTEPLTDRERTVLARMGQAMSTEDIAVELFLSVNTIKTHQKSIYRKLSVARRNDAVRRGRELQII